MKKKINILLLILFTFTKLCSQEKFECIGLGSQCSTASGLSKLGLRNAAYPFDWVVTPLNSLIEAIYDDFKDYLNPNYFKIRSDRQGVFNKYGICFVHDFPNVNDIGVDINAVELVGGGVLSFDWLNYLQPVKEKYQRRINRFIEQCNSNKKIYFFRHYDTCKQDALRLRDLIELKYPNLDFILVVISYGPEYKNKWNENKIKNYDFDHTVWNDPNEWRRILIDLGIIQKNRVSFSKSNSCQNNFCNFCNIKNTGLPQIVERFDLA